MSSRDSAHLVTDRVIRRPFVLAFELFVKTSGTTAVRVDRRESGLLKAGLRAYTHLAAFANDRAGEEVYSRAPQPQSHSAGLGGNRSVMISGRQGDYSGHRQIVEHDARSERAAIRIVHALFHPCPVTPELFRVLRKLRNRPKLRASSARYSLDCLLLTERIFSNIFTARTIDTNDTKGTAL